MCNDGFSSTMKSSGGGFFGFMGSLFSSSKSNKEVQSERLEEVSQPSEPDKSASMPTGAKTQAEVPLGKKAGYSGKRYRQEVDTNIIGFNLSVLKDKTEIATGDAIICEKCKAMFNVYSELVHLEGVEVNSQCRVCEFCGNSNKVNIEPEEMPKSESAQQSMMKKGGGEDTTIMFCIDVSGSMCITQPVQGKLELKYSKVKKMQDLMKFSGGSHQYISGESRGTTYISRMQCVQTAIEGQLKELALGAPKRKVGIVTFNNEVTLIRDRHLPPKIYAGDKLNDYEGLIEAAQNDAGTYMTKVVEEAKADLIKKLEQIEESGQTALGPALTVALGVALKGTPGSCVIIFTDGLANVGLGSVENLKDKEAVKSFYTKLGELAKERGVSISIVSIVSAECNLEMLSPLTNITGGDIVKVNPMNLSSDFANILSENIIATNVELRVKLHKGLTFRNEDATQISKDGSLLRKPIGNATDDQEIIVEYCIKPKTELNKMKDLNFEKLSKIPFQAQISYVNLEGMKCVRLVSKNQEITFEKEADYKVISVNAVQQSAKLAGKGKLREAQATAVHWDHMLQGSAEHSTYIGASNHLYRALQRQQHGVCV
jgi:hypothetical protein